MGKQAVLKLVRNNKATKANLALLAKIKATTQEAEQMGIKFIEFTSAEMAEVNTWIRAAKAS